MALELPSQKGSGYPSHLPPHRSECRHLVKDFWDFTNAPKKKKYNSNGHYCYYNGYKVCEARKKCSAACRAVAQLHVVVCMLPADPTRKQICMLVGRSNMTCCILAQQHCLSIARACFIFLKFFSGDLCLQPETSVQPEQQALQHSRHEKKKGGDLKKMSN